MFPSLSTNSPSHISKETVLVLGSTDHSVVSAVMAALRSNRKVLAVVRNRESAENLITHVGTSEGITFVEADITAETGIKGVVDQVRAGNLPDFQHVYSTGGFHGRPSLADLPSEDLNRNLAVDFQSNFIAYRETAPYLLEQDHWNSTWTLCTGPQPATTTHGAIYSMATAACRDHENTNVRFNELFLGMRVEVDQAAAQNGTVPSSVFSGVYEQILSRPDIRSCRVSVLEVDDMRSLKFERKF